MTVPDYRYRDLEREIDLIEEVARLYGYDRFVHQRLKHPPKIFKPTLPSQGRFWVGI